jgi:hypothetical protein
MTVATRLLSHARAVPALFLIAAFAAGCGYSTSALIRDDIHTVHVPVFDNHTWYRGIEVELTRAILDEIKQHTNLLIASGADADSTLEGEITDIQLETLTKTEDNVVLLKRITIEVRFRWRDNLTERDILPWQKIVEKTVVPPLPGDSPEALPFRELARHLVERMEKDW